MVKRKSGQRQTPRPLKKPNTEECQLRRDTMAESLDFLLFNEIKSDVVFIVGPQHVRIHAHQFFLAIRSTVFDAMFYGALPRENEVQLPDIEEPAFRNLLRYLYTDTVEIEPDSVIATLYAAKKYAVLGLENRCEELLESNLNPENAFLLLTQARLFEASHLVELCWKLIDRRTQACLDAKCFLDIDYDTLELVLRRDTLRIREICIYEAVMRWSQAECKRHQSAVTSENQRRILKDCTKLIRYPLMGNHEFAQGPTEDGLLTDKEIIRVFQYINRNPKPVCEFLDKPRQGIGSEAVCYRFSKTAKTYRTDNNSCNIITFKVDQNIFVSGFGLFGLESCLLQEEFEVVIKLIQTASKITMASNKVKLTVKPLAISTIRCTDLPYKVLFKEPVYVSANTDYCAVAITMGATYAKQNARSKVTVKCNNDEKVTFQFYNDAHSDYKNVERGQIPQIIFHL